MTKPVVVFDPVVGERALVAADITALGFVAGGVGANGVIGTAAGLILAAGSAALDGSNPTPITVTGIGTLLGFVAFLKEAAIGGAGLGTSVLTATWTGNVASVYGWKPTSNADPTLIASTGTDTFTWIAVGTA